MKKTAKDKKQLKKELEELWKEYCLLRDKTCQYCGSSDNLQVHHIISRRNNSIKYDTDNGIVLCKKCHTKISLSPSEYMAFTIWYIKHFSLEKLEYLQMKSKEVKNWSIMELETEIKKIKQMIEEMK